MKADQMRDPRALRAELYESLGRAMVLLRRLG
jgi:hypothetical protein